MTFAAIGSMLAGLTASQIAAGAAVAGTVGSLGMQGAKMAQGSGGSNTTGAVMGGVNSLLSGLMGSQLGGGSGDSMAPTPAFMADSSGMGQPSLEAQGFAPPPPAPVSATQAVPGTSPWGIPVSSGMAGGGTAAGPAPPYNPNAPPSWSYQPASMAPSYGGMTGGGTAAGMYGAPGPQQATPPTPPNPYMSAIGAAAPALSNVLAARIAQNRTTQTTGKSPYAVPFQTQQVTVGGSPPPARLSPLERYRMMLSGMR